MPGRDWIRSHKKTVAAAALGLALMGAVALGLWFGWDLKTLIGWRALVDYINPTDATGRKDAVQVYAVIVAGVVAAITAAVGLLNLRLTRKNLEQQRELEAQRAQGTALQAYYEQIGNLITDKDLLNTQRKEIRELARGQTLTVLQEVDGDGKRSLLAFLHGAGLLRADKPAVELAGAALGDVNLQGVKLEGANLQHTNLQGANLQGANLQHANLQDAKLQGAKLQLVNLMEARLWGTKLQEANLQGARVTARQLAVAGVVVGVIMPDGRKFGVRLKDKEGRGEDGVEHRPS